MVTVECDGGGDIHIEADEVQLTLTGDCEDIEVDGSENSITGEDTASLDIEGDTNSVTLESAGEVTVEGDENSVAVEEATTIDVDGEDNSVTYVSGNPVISSEGNNNSITIG